MEGGEKEQAGEIGRRESGESPGRGGGAGRQAAGR